jgi:hypothetical protein
VAFDGGEDQIRRSVSFNAKKATPPGDFLLKTPKLGARILI